MLKRLFANLANTRLGVAALRTLVRPTGVFICYPVQQRFADHFCSRSRQRKIPWSPYVVGLIRQGTATSLLCVVSSNEVDFARPENRTALAGMQLKAEALKRQTGAAQISYAGVLPTVLRARKLLRDSTEAEVTCRAVSQAVSEVLREDARLVEKVAILGGRGYVGRRLISALQQERAIPSELRASIISIDKGDPIPEGGPLLLVNCSLPGVIDLMVNLVPPGSVILNEVYPAPDPSTVRALGARDIAVFHIAGVQGWAWPQFPGEYSTAIPCCAALGHSRLQVVMHRLVASDA